MLGAVIKRPAIRSDGSRVEIGGGEAAEHDPAGARHRVDDDQLALQGDIDQAAAIAQPRCDGQPAVRRDSTS